LEPKWVERAKALSPGASPGLDSARATGTGAWYGYDVCARNNNMRSKQQQQQCSSSSTNTQRACTQGSSRANACGLYPPL
jgi:hypothetical protein